MPLFRPQIFSLRPVLLQHHCARSQSRAISTPTSSEQHPDRRPQARESPGPHALITGGSRGIGLAIAQALARSIPTLRCTLIGRSEATLSAAVDTLSSSSPAGAGADTLSAAQQETSRAAAPTHGYTVGDVADQTFWQRLTERTSALGRIDVLVNAAGVTHSTLLPRMPDERIQGILDTNLLGTIWACKYVGGRMLRTKRAEDDGLDGILGKRGKGVVVNVASLLGMHGGKGASVYAASKAGVLGLTRSLAAEWGSAGIRVNAVVPGYVETEMTAVMAPAASQEALSKIPLGRYGSAEEIADAAVFLVRNQYASNCVLNLDGGLSATI